MTEFGSINMFIDSLTKKRKMLSRSPLKIVSSVNIEKVYLHFKTVKKDESSNNHQKVVETHFTTESLS